LNRIIQHSDAVRLLDRVSDDYDAAVERVAPTVDANNDWTTGSEEAA
jgi:hypothetical protein